MPPIPPITNGFRRCIIANGLKKILFTLIILINYSIYNYELAYYYYLNFFLGISNQEAFPISLRSCFLNILFLLENSYRKRSLDQAGSRMPSHLEVSNSAVGSLIDKFFIKSSLISLFIHAFLANIYHLFILMQLLRKPLLFKTLANFSIYSCYLFNADISY